MVIAWAGPNFPALANSSNVVQGGPKIPGLDGVHPQPYVFAQFHGPIAAGPLQCMGALGVA